MTYLVRPVESVEAELARLQKRDRALYYQLMKKLDKIAEAPYTAGKWMHGSYAGVREVHLMHGRFVLMFRVDDKEQIVSLVNLEHHPDKY